MAWEFYVKDVLDRLIALAKDSKTYGDVYNIGATKEATIGNLAIMIKDMTGELLRNKIYSL
jgi:nucleoside-diphosphate-sugar epimerase